MGCTITPAVFAGRPEERHLSSFRHVASEGIDVYVHPSLKVSQEGLSIGLDKWAFMKRLNVKGVEIKNA